MVPFLGKHTGLGDCRHHRRRFGTLPDGQSAEVSGQDRPGNGHPHTHGLAGFAQAAVSGDREKGFDGALDCPRGSGGTDPLWRRHGLFFRGSVSAPVLCG